MAAASLSVGYRSNQALPGGTIVAADSQSSGAVVAANSQSSPTILGVVVVDSTLAVSQSNSQVQVTSDGVAKVLVSDINGPVRRGDRITTSPLDGIGMKATETSRVVGLAQDDLTDNTPGVQTKTVTDKQTKQKQVLISLVSVTVNIGSYQPIDNQTVLPRFIRDISSSISGREPSSARIWSSLVILMVTLLIVIVLIYGAVRSSIGAIGRNP